MIYNTYEEVYIFSQAGLIKELVNLFKRYEIKKIATEKFKNDLIDILLIAQRRDPAFDLSYLTAFNQSVEDTAKSYHCSCVLNEAFVIAKQLRLREQEEMKNLKRNTHISKNNNSFSLVIENGNHSVYAQYYEELVLYIRMKDANAIQALLNKGLKKALISIR